MVDANFYQQTIFQAIAANIGLNSSDLRFFPTIRALFEDDRQLFELFDIIPGAASVFEESAPLFSQIYGELLQSQPKSFIFKAAEVNFENPHYRLAAESSAENHATPLYSPSSADLSGSIANGSSFNFSLDSSQYPSPEKTFYPTFPGFVVDPVFQKFNQIAEDNRFIFTLHFDKIVTLPVKPGQWFTSAAFARAFQSGGAGWLTGPETVSWNDLFDDDGILQFIFNGVLAVSGVKLELQSFGNYDIDLFNALKNRPGAASFPVYFEVENLSQDYTLGTDQSITITTRIPSSEILLLAMQTASVKQLIGSNL